MDRLEPLPAGWRWVTLNDVQAHEPRAITDGPFGSHLTSGHYTDSGPRVVRLQNIGDGEFIDARAHISQSHFESLRAHEVLPGDVLVASLGESPPRSCLAPTWLGPAIVKADCIRVRLSKEVDARWILYALRSPFVRRWARDRTYGVGRPRLGLRTIRAIPIPLAPSDEQRRIVEILEDHFSRIDAASETLTTAALRTPTLVTSAVQRELATASRLQWASIDEIAGGDRSATTIGPFGSSLKTSDYTSSGVPLIFVRNVRSGDYRANRRFISQEKAAELRAHVAEPGDVLITKMGEPPGDASVYSSQEKGVVTADVIRLRPAAQFNSRYLAYTFLAPEVRSQILRITSGVAQKKVSLGRFRSQLRLPVVDLDRQCEVVARLDQVVAARERLSRSLASSHARSVTLRRALLQAAFTGRLSGHASDEDVVQELAGV